VALDVDAFVLLVRARLREANNSKLGETQAGDNSAPTVAANARIIELGQLVAIEICKTCHYLNGTGTSDGFVAGMNRIALSDLTYPIYGTVWRPLTVTWNGVALRETEEGNTSQVARFGQHGTPRMWWREGESHIGLFPTPDRSAPLAVRGACKPELQDGSPDSWNYLDDEDLIALQVAGTAHRLSLLDTDNEALALRGRAWKAEYDAERMRRWSMIDDTTRKRAFPTPPTPQRGR
jgi:hypothetical protein